MQLAQLGLVAREHNDSAEAVAVVARIVALGLLDDRLAFATPRKGGASSSGTTGREHDRKGVWHPRQR